MYKMTDIANYDEWDYRRFIKVDPCNCEDEECSTYVLSVRGAFSTELDVDDYEWIKVASLTEEMLIDTIKNCISSMDISDNTIDQRHKLENLLLKELNDD